jgi:hypothetical protein
MRFLLDANLSPVLVPDTKAAGYDVVHVVDLGLLTASDTAILGRAETDGYVQLEVVDDGRAAGLTEGEAIGQYPSLTRDGIHAAAACGAALACEGRCGACGQRLPRPSTPPTRHRNLVCRRVPRVVAT